MDMTSTHTEAAEQVTECVIVQVYKAFEVRSTTGEVIRCGEYLTPKNAIPRAEAIARKRGWYIADTYSELRAY